MIKVYVSLIGAGLLIAVGLLLWGGSFGRVSASQHSADDPTAIAQLIAQQCSMGQKTEQQSDVTASIAKYVSGLSSGAKVSTSDVGALIDKITPNDTGLAVYKAYTDCLKQQAAILLNQRGIHLVAPDQEDIEREKDLQALQDISEITPSTPKARLIEIFGQPVSEGGMTPVDDSYPTPDAEVYRYKHMAFAIDYTLKDRRVALALATKDPLQGSAMFFDQINGQTISSVGKECGKITPSVHGVAQSEICPAFIANGNIKRVYYFYTIGLAGPLISEDEPCENFANSMEDLPFEKCPGMASSPALAVIMADEYGDDKEFKGAINQFSYELNFGDQIPWRSAREQEEFQNSHRGESDQNFDRRHRALIIAAIRNRIVNPYNERTSLR